MKKLIIFLLILAVLTAVVFIAIKITDRYDKDTGNDLSIDNDKTTEEVVKDDSGSVKISENAIEDSGSSGGTRGSGESENNPETITDKELPLDLYTKSCGFYFLEHEVCAGVCPEGQCLIDEKSCYCRI